MGTYRIVVTDFRGNLLFTITDSDFVSLEIIDQLNDAGSWKLRSRTKEPCPFSACNAIIVFRDDVQIYNGYVTKIEETYEVSSKTWNWTVKGENHIGLLKHRLIYPTKNNDGTLRDQYYRMSPARLKCLQEREPALPGPAAPWAVVRCRFDRNGNRSGPAGYPRKLPF